MRRLALAAALAATLAGSPAASAHHGMGEPHPADWATNRCARLAYALATTPVSTDRFFGRMMRGAGCERTAAGDWQPRRR